MKLIDHRWEFVRSTQLFLQFLLFFILKVGFFERWQVAHQGNVRFLFLMVIPQILYVNTLQTHLQKLNDTKISSRSSPIATSTEPNETLFVKKKSYFIVLLRIISLFFMYIPYSTHQSVGKRKKPLQIWFLITCVAEKFKIKQMPSLKKPTLCESQLT